MQRILLLLSVMLWCYQVDTQAQLYPVNNTDAFTVNYFSNIDGADSVFLHRDAPAVLKAISPDSTAGWEFQWQQLDTASGGFVNRHMINDSVSFDTIASNGCYQVTMSKDTLEHRFRAWVLIIESFGIENPHKDASDTLTSNVSTCNRVLIRLQSNIDDWMYDQLEIEDDSIFSTGNKMPFDLTDHITVNWSSTTESEYSIPQTEAMTLTDNSPPPVPTSYYAEADFLGYTAYDTSHLDEIATEANLSVEVIDYEHPCYIDSLETSEPLLRNYRYNYNQLFSGNSGPAPLWVAFTFEESENASEFYIDFGDTLGVDDSTFYDIDATIYRRYDVPGEYEILLTTTSDEGCENQGSPQSVTVEDADVPDLPNVFIAGGGQTFSFSNEELENVFRIEDVSYRYVEVYIFNRWGLQVHEYIGDIKKWTGWDGRINDRNQFAKPGVYYYVIKATNWHRSDNPNVNRKTEHQGFFHLYRAE